MRKSDSTVEKLAPGPEQGSRTPISRTTIKIESRAISLSGSVHNTILIDREHHLFVRNKGRRSLSRSSSIF